MTAHAALLRGINVGGRKMVAMADLRELCTGLGLRDVRSLLQSGNLVFRSEGRTGAALERLLEAETNRRLGLETAFFVRTAEQWEAIVARNPMRSEAKRDPGHLLVLFLKDVPAPGAVESLRSAITGRETIRAEGKEAYLYYPDGVGRSRVTNALIEKKLGTLATGRNWNTVLKLRAQLRS